LSPSRNKTIKPVKLTEQTLCQEAATDLWKANTLITNSNPNKFDQLNRATQNYISGDNDSYPITFNNVTIV
jgi:hypothetical protein